MSDRRTCSSLSPTGERRTSEATQDSYAVRTVIEDVFVEGKNEVDGRTPMSGDMDVIQRRILIRMASMIMKVWMVGSLSEAADNRGVRPESILASRNNTEMAEGTDGAI